MAEDRTTSTSGQHSAGQHSAGQHGTGQQTTGRDASTQTAGREGSSQQTTGQAAAGRESAGHQAALRESAMRESATRDTAAQDTQSREAGAREGAKGEGQGREGTKGESQGRGGRKASSERKGESGSGQRKAEAGAERPPTYALVPRSLDDLDEAGGGHTLSVPKDQLTWQHGLTHIKTAHGPDLTERARELVRRALGELYQEGQGAEPASALAHEVADSLSDTEKLNELGDEQHAAEHRAMKQRGQAYFG